MIPPSWTAYVAMARPDHWLKHIFILPGIVLAYLLVDSPQGNLVEGLVFGFPAACLLASANYVINEWTDARYDQFHPLKKDRPAAAGTVKLPLIVCEYLFLVAAGLILAACVNLSFLWTGVIFLLMGCLYNLHPFRLKDRVYMDVIVESVNNPIRLILGWLIVSPTTIPPMSLTIFYWLGGAFLMTTKRLAEYRYMSAEGRLVDLKSYRSSFKNYSEQSLLLTSFMYGVLSSFMIATFLIKYRNEYLFAYPFFAVLFTYYLAVGLRPVSHAQTPEKLYKDWRLLIIVFLLVVALAFLTYTDIPLAERILGINEAINYKFWE